jgi:hypothetical protein
MESVHEMIERRAYELFLARGSLNGYAQQDWAQAEKDVMTEIENKKKAKAPQAQPKPAEKPVEKVAEKPIEKPAAKPAEKPVEKAEVKPAPAKFEKKDEPVKETKELPRDKTVKAPAAAVTAPAKKRATKKNHS